MTLRINDKLLLGTFGVLFFSAGILLFTNFAKATTPNIDICVKKNGNVYIIGDAVMRDACKKHDNLITINPNGGPQGIPGEIGPIGPQGPIGLTGTTGPQGIQGIQGLQGYKGDQGDTGPTGPQGPTGQAGANGLNGVSGWERIQGDVSNNGTAIANCPIGKKVIGGGYNTPDHNNISPSSNWPIDDDTWMVTIKDVGNTSLQAYAICITAN